MKSSYSSTKMAYRTFTYLYLFLVCLTLGAEDPRRFRVVFLGDSLTAGYGLEKEEAYPALIQERIDARGWPVEVVNAGVSGETTAGGRRRIAWLLKRPADVLVIALGGNDGLRGVDVKASQANLEALIDEARRRSPGIRIVLAGMQMPPNLGEAYTAAFRRMYPRVAEAKEVALVPFLLEGVGGVPEFNLDDGIHPNAAGQQRLAENVWEILEPLLRKLVP